MRYIEERMAFEVVLPLYHSLVTLARDCEDIGQRRKMWCISAIGRITSLPETNQGLEDDGVRIDDSYFTMIVIPLLTQAVPALNTDDWTDVHVDLMLAMLASIIRTASAEYPRPLVLDI